MPYSNYNPNPAGRSVGDCAVRAIARAMDTDWDTAYAMLSAAGMAMKDLPNADSVWGGVLLAHGWHKGLLDDGYSVASFADEHPTGKYVLSMPGRHVVAVDNGNYYDSWDSGNELPVYYYEQDEDRR